LDDGDHVVTQLAEGEFESRVLNLRQLELFDESWPSELKNSRSKKP
jgi:hypothetical protein